MGCLLGFLIMNCFSCLNDYFKHLNINCMFGGGGKQVLEVIILCLLFGFGLKVLKFNFYFKGFDRFTGNGLCSKTDLEVKRCSKTPSGKHRPEKKNVQNSDKMKSSKLNLEDNGSIDEDYVFDVLSLRKSVKKERRRANSLYLELEEERMASATAAEEAMAMILRLQNEKSLAEMEAKQYKRLAKEKQLHDQEVILSLQWLVLKHESERCLLEDQLKLCQQKLRVQSSNSEGDEHENFEESCCSFEFARENGLESRLFSSLDMDLSIE